MPARWSADSVLALASDEPSRRTAMGLARPAPWTRTGAAGELVWGLCAGSGMNPYQTIVDLDGPAYKCSCPSRKFPCKHALALLLLWSGGAVPDEDDPSDFAAAWLATRRKKTVAGTPADITDAGEEDQAIREKKAAAADKRAQERADRVASGLAELTEWLRDQVRVGLAASVQAATSTGAGLTSAVAARMVDAQAPGVAGMLRGLSAAPASGDEWPARLLSEYGMLHLLARAHERLDTLPPGLAATVRSRIGYTTGRQEVLSRPAITDRWEVLGVRDLTDGEVPGRRIWARGLDTHQSAMLLTFYGPAGWQDPDAARLRAGAEFRADLHFYPGQPPMRALIGTRHGDPARAKPPVPDGGIDTMLADYATGLEQDPWLTTWPALLDGTPVPPSNGRKTWNLIDRTDVALPLLENDSLWTLLAVSGGHPVTVAGEWHPDGLLPLTVWLDDEAVAL
jgi:SWIM zinc finger